MGDKQCWDEPREECSTSYEEKCWTEDKQECSTVPKCKTVYDNKCSTSYRTICEDEGYGGKGKGKSRGKRAVFGGPLAGGLPALAGGLPLGAAAGAAAAGTGAAGAVGGAGAGAATAAQILTFGMLPGFPVGLAAKLPLLALAGKKKEEEEECYQIPQTQCYKVPEHHSSYMPMEHMSMGSYSQRMKRDTNMYSPHYDADNENCVTQYVTVCPEDEHYGMAMPGYGMPSGYGMSSGKKFGKSRKKRFAGSFVAGGAGAGAGVGAAKTGAVIKTFLPPLVPLPLLGLKALPLLALKKKKLGLL